MTSNHLQRTFNCDKRSNTTHPCF